MVCQNASLLNMLPSLGQDGESLPSNPFHSLKTLRCSVSKRSVTPRDITERCAVVRAANARMSPLVDGIA
jgi:hypothetical protein